jgi:predicted PurR-regulated permease PerM
MFIGYVIYRRTAKIKKCDIAILIVAVALSLCTMYQPLEHILPFAVSAVLTVVSLVRFIAVLIKKAGAKEVLKRAILLAISICLLVLLIPGAYEILCYYGRMHLYPGMFY